MIKNMKWLIFSILWQMLYLAQLFIVKPGTDVSPYAYQRGVIKYIRFGGLTSSALASIILLLFCFISVLLQKKIKLSKSVKEICILVLIFLFINLLPGAGLISSIDYIAKLVMPMIFFVFINLEFKYIKSKFIINCVVNLNFFVLAQVFLCNLITGKFSVNTYYYEMSEEYFGYFNSPHPFTALLGVLAIWNVILISCKINKRINSILFIANALLIYLSNVRTYALGLVIAIVYLVLQLKSLKKRIPRYIYFIFIVIALLGVIYIMINGDYGSIRKTNGDISSGRFLRWYLDLKYFIDSISLYHQLIGSGAETVYAINQKLIGTYINSLNCFLDLLIDIGIVGLIVYMRAYYVILKWSLTKKNKIFVFALCIYIAVGAMINNLLPYVTIMPLFIVLLIVLHNHE